MGKTTAESGSAKMIPADCVAVLLMALGNTSISKAQYDMMSALDGNRTASSFEHQFRSITQKAKELKTRVDNGEKFNAIAPAKKRNAAAMDTPPSTPSKSKNALKAKSGTPNKRKKTTASEDKSPSPSSGNQDLQGSDSYFDDAYNQTNIKSEFKHDDDLI